MKVKTIRKDIRVPEPIVEKVQDYQVKNAIPNWTGALLELVRKGLEAEKKQD